jgi:hypothetical protein
VQGHDGFVRWVIPAEAGPIEHPRRAKLCIQDGRIGIGGAGLRCLAKNQHYFWIACGEIYGAADVARIEKKIVTVEVDDPGAFCELVKDPSVIG